MTLYATADAPADDDSPPDYEYDGSAYVRPMGRGVTLRDAPGENDIADELEGQLGAYQSIRLQIRAWKKDATP